MPPAMGNEMLPTVRDVIETPGRGDPDLDIVAQQLETFSVVIAGSAVMFANARLRFRDMHIDTCPRGGLPHSMLPALRLGKKAAFLWFPRFPIILM